MKKVAAFSPAELAEIFSETAAEKGMTPAAAEKDFWLCRVLMIIFEHPDLSPILRLKGGTSLSKCYGITDRFSEDIDLVLDWTVLTGEDPVKKSKTRQDRFNKALNDLAAEYIRKEILPALENGIDPTCSAEVDANDSLIIDVGYPKAFDNEYLRPVIRLEIGPLAAMVPSGKLPVRPYAAEALPDLFEAPEVPVETIKAERTFWEKVTILHAEAHRPEGRAQQDRYSRHYYDVYRMLDSEAGINAVSDEKLLADVVSFKARFYPSGWANYESAVKGTLKLVPGGEMLKRLKVDYGQMREMIFGDYTDFDSIIERLAEFEAGFNGKYA
ncbi:MAG TPA: nucleotidyl transferase AbiEii/AbiGii toxin family protein [Thermodesulfobacteriota bacterium]|nr:nucleotidyl transferase AbiEii/AbiGii toxin family protein [Thermodesulfobacteriota bacterium]